MRKITFVLMALTLAACASKIEPGAAAENAGNVRVLTADCRALAVRAGLATEVIAALDARNAVYVALAEEIAAKASGE